MSDLSPADLDAEAQRLIDGIGVPKRRVRPRLARKLNEAEDLEVMTDAGGIMAWRLGSGPATLMVHGWEDDNAMWSPLIDDCAEILRASVAFDQPGHGWSPAEECSIETAGRAVLAVAEALGPIDSVVGHSFGTSATVWALANGLNVPRVALIASAVGGVRRTRDWTQWENTMLDNGERPEVIARALEKIAEAPPKDIRAYDFASVIPKMTAKALLIHSMDDDAVPYSNSEALHAAWPDSELILLDGLGHRLIGQDPDVVDRLVEFFESQYN